MLKPSIIQSKVVSVVPQIRDRSFVIRVAIPAPLRKSFDYTADINLNPGTRVLVSFGRRRLIGIVLPYRQSNYKKALKPIIRVLDEAPVIPHRILKLLLWAADYYHFPVGLVIHAALPPTLRKSGPARDPVSILYFRRNQRFTPKEVATLLARAPKQKQLYLHTPPARLFVIDDLLGIPELQDMKQVQDKLNLLIKHDYITEEFSTPVAEPLKTSSFDGILNKEQQIAIKCINSSSGKFQAFVLYGITGSGKTEVYLHSIEECFAKEQQALVLVPEISLTPQLVDRFRARLGNQVHCYHSAMTASQRYQTWWQARKGTAGVVLGTRSSIFIPIKNLGQIVVDEEHDISYKQQENFRYHARDMAIQRASFENIPVILGSATPSLESMENVTAGKYRLLQLRQRAGKAKLPNIHLVDIRRHPSKDGLSPQLLEAINRQLAQKKQTILYINRRGFSPLAECRLCYWQARCDRCDTNLTYHKADAKLMCHYCGKNTSVPNNCPRCNKQLYFKGTGTQRVEQALVRMFPDARIFRFDRDRLKSFGELQQALDEINSGNIDIIVGTRLISKGHDFPGVALVGVINPDQSLYSVDFRAPEYMFQQLVQVAGRAGRSEEPGNVIIQTAHPDNVYLDLVKNHRFDDFFQICRNERYPAHLPPFSHIALWRAESTAAGEGLKFLDRVRKMGVSRLHSPDANCIQIMDPVSSPIEKVAGRYRAQLMVRSSGRRQLHSLLDPWITQVENSPGRRKVRWSLDIDPMDMF